MDDSLPGTSLLAARLAHIPEGALDFTPVPLKGRRDGWTAARQRAFVTGLAAGLGMSAAARAAGMSRQSAYLLLERPGAESLCAACERARAFARSRPLAPGSTCWERGVEGVLVPLRHRGRIIGYRRKYDGRALGLMLRTAYRLREQGE
jgi:hypothetical protein